MSHASMPKEYLPFAFAAAIFLINRLPTPNLEFQSPYEKLFQKQPNYNRLRVHMLSMVTSLHETQVGRSVKRMCLSRVFNDSACLPVCSSSHWSSVPISTCFLPRNSLLVCGSNFSKVSDFRNRRPCCFLASTASNSNSGTATTSSDDSSFPVLGFSP